MCQVFHSEKVVICFLSVENRAMCLCVIRGCLIRWQLEKMNTDHSVSDRHMAILLVKVINRGRREVGNKP